MRAIILTISIIGLSMIRMPVLAFQNIHTIKPGEHVPDTRIANLHNYKKSTARLAEFYSEKPLILAFWDTHCNTCLKSLPKLNMLRSYFKDSFNVLSVTRENNTGVKQLFSSLDTFKNINLPYITDDTILVSYFRHRYIPHIVWINTKGIVAAITTEDEVMEENIRDFINDDTVVLFEKNDDFSFDMYKPYVPADSLLQYRSVLSSYNPYVRAGYYEDAQRDSISNIISMKRVLMINTSIINLFYNAFDNITGTGIYTQPVYARIVFETPDQVKNTLLPEAANTTDIYRKAQHLYCYELITKEKDRQAFFEDVLNDLNRFFPVKARIEKRLMPCYAIIKKANDKIIFSRADEPPFNATEINKITGDTKFIMKHMRLGTLINALNEFSLNDPVIDETGISGFIDVEISFKNKDKKWGGKYDVEYLKNELNRYGLDLVPREKYTDMLVIY